MVNSWVLTNQHDCTGILSREITPDSLSLDDRMIFSSLTALMNKSGYSPEIRSMELPASKVFYSDLSEDEDVPYCFFVKTSMSQSIEKIQDVFDESSKIVHDLPLQKGYEINTDSLENLSSLIDTCFDTLQTKIAFAGYAGVGKTTIRHLLRGEQLPIIHDPTMGVTIKPSKINGMLGNIIVWDTGGQQGFLNMLPTYVPGSDLVAVVSDSSLENALRSKKLISTIHEHAPEAKIVGIANKQDLPTALTPERVEQILDIPTLGLRALDFDKRDNLIRFLEEHLT